MIADEVITAFGRTGAWSGSRLQAVKPGLMSIAKGISNAYYPVCTAMISEKVTEVFETNKDAMGSIGHGYTYSGHPVGCTAAIAALKEIKKQSLAENAKARSEDLKAGLLMLQKRHDSIGDVRGIGLMCALELVSDRGTKTPASKASMATVNEGSYQAGAMIRTSGNSIILSLPLIITSEDVQRILASLESGFSSL